MTLKIGPVVETTPVKLALVLSAEVHAALADYARVHAAAFGRDVPLADLAALMIERFLDSDAAFKRARKALRRSGTEREEST